ncbi:MAG: hypothetical protein LKJ69_04625 [Lactobacillus sp.]|jgi:hypothetical protein|nr:hypothetical protein [Lactobacillus sp.]MCI2032668.1 hypothetical protein [Lactobacillus sp.]
MAHYRIMNWGMVLVSFVFSLILFILAPRQIVMHFNGIGVPDSWFGPSGLYLEPVLLFVVAWLCERVSVRARRRDGLEALPMVTVSEWRLLALVFVAMVVFALLQLYQVRWL